MKIQIVRDAEYAPCGFLIVKAGGDYKDESNTVLVQTDLDFPGVAASFGWEACECGATDGTIDCPHRNASDMIEEARQFLIEAAHNETEIEDPGYFSA